MLTQFFMWCTLLNFVFLIFSFLFLAFAGGFVYRIHSKWFPMSRETFNILVYSFLAAHKILWVVFNLVPWISLNIIR
ncbi:MAG: DUF6868 family protein [Candidatus Sumerlaeia bacterium]